MQDPQTRPSLLDRLRDTQDPEAWSRFEQTYGDLIVGYCRRRGVQEPDAEDIRQITFLKLMRALESFEYDRSKGRFRDYLYRVVRSAISDRFKGKPSPTPLGQIETAANDLDEVWTQQWRAFHMDRAWRIVGGSIEQRSSQVFARLLDGGTVREVAAQFDMSEQAVHKIKQRVRDRLREQVDRQIREEDGVAT